MMKAASVPLNISVSIGCHCHTAASKTLWVFDICTSVLPGLLPLLLGGLAVQLAPAASSVGVDPASGLDDCWAAGSAQDGFLAAGPGWDGFVAAGSGLEGFLVAGSPFKRW